MKRHYHLLCAFIAFVVAFYPQPVSAKCVAHTVAAGNGTSATVLALVPDGGSADLQAAGFQDAVCGNIDKADYRAKVCKPEVIGNRGFQRQLEIQAGISFAQLCTAALAEAGLSPQAATSSQFSPSNRRPPVPRGGPGMVGPLGPPGQPNAPAGGN